MLKRILYSRVFLIVFFIGFQVNSVNIEAKTDSQSYIIFNQSYSDDQLINYASRGILINDSLVNVSVVFEKADEIQIKKTSINRKLSSRKSIDGIEFSTYAVLAVYTTEMTDFLGTASITNYATYETRTFEGVETIRITNFAHKINSYDTLFGSPTKLESKASQTGTGYTSTGTRFIGISETKSLVTTSSFFTKFSMNTSFIYFCNPSLSIGGVNTTMTWRNKDNSTWSLNMNNVVYQP